MKVKCLHGFFIFEQSIVGQISDFMSLTGLTLVPRENYYTFEGLEDAPNYSLKGRPLVGEVLAIETYQGQAWEVFEANGMVFDFLQGILVPISSVTQRVTLSAAGNRYISPGLILPGSLTGSGERVKEYSGFFSRQTLRWMYSEVGFV
jgi:hypothetical protein